MTFTAQHIFPIYRIYYPGPQLFTELKADLRQDMDTGFAFSSSFKKMTIKASASLIDALYVLTEICHPIGT